MGGVCGVEGRCVGGVMVRLVSDGEPAPEAPLPPDGREKIINFPLSRSSRMERSMADVPRALAVFFVAGCAEIGGGWLVWQWVREDRPWPFGLLGGLVLVTSVDGPAIVRRLSIPTWRVVVCVPTYHFLTSTARAALPTQYSKTDAIYNVGHALLVMEALRTGDHHLLDQVIRDRLHVPYRLPLIPGARDACRAALEQGATAATISGAGPGLIAFASERHEQIGAAMVQAFADARLVARYWVLETIDQGADFTVGHI